MGTARKKLSLQIYPLKKKVYKNLPHYLHIRVLDLRCAVSISLQTSAPVVTTVRVEFGSILKII